MPTATTFTAAITGAEAHIFTIGAVPTDGSPGLHLEGLLRETRDHVRAGILSSGLP